ncbi:hypothetical protein [Nonomuraea pusilla]
MKPQAVGGERLSACLVELGGTHAARSKRRWPFSAM